MFAEGVEQRQPECGPARRLDTPKQPMGGHTGLRTPIPAPDQVLDHAVYDLCRRFPDYSAAKGSGSGWRWLLAALGLGAVLALVPEPDWARATALVLTTLPFVLVVQIRLAAMWLRARGALQMCDPPALNQADLPAYSLLVPLYRETQAVPGLIAALARFDYPETKIEIFLITEADDAATRDALTAAGLTAVMRVLTVPDGLPRTKPRALNYALQFARGDLVAIFDAEDAPEPDQLRRAAAVFAAGGAKLACVQAPLQIYNPNETALTRQFALEYAALFDAVLPALHHMKLPLPLGGTSNHFRRDCLESAGAWDPFNVTEDADLGFRLARFGHEVALTGSTTWEEAPPTFKGWFSQRTRWLKGWMQTYVVHMQSPRRLWRDFGPWRFFGFQAILAGMILSALVHPWFYAGLGWDLWQHATAQGETANYGLLARALWWVCLINLGLSYAVSMALGAVSLAKRGQRPGAATLLFLPIYWLAISLAAYRAVIELIARPYHWDKTEHRGIDGVGQLSGRP